jgi:hypothetical protein
LHASHEFHHAPHTPLVIPAQAEALYNSECWSIQFKHASEGHKTSVECFALRI